MDNPRHRFRKHIRVPGYDYAQPGYYFVTICTSNRICSLGKIEVGCVILSEAGVIVHRRWLDLPNHYSNVALDAFIVMPNHLHGIAVIDACEQHLSFALLQQAVDATPASPSFATPAGLSAERLTANGPARNSLGSIIGSFKSASSRELNALPGTRTGKFWQTNYFEHIIRSEQSLYRIRDYIEGNPAQWAADIENPEFSKR